MVISEVFDLTKLIPRLGDPSRRERERERERERQYSSLSCRERKRFVLQREYEVRSIERGEREDRLSLKRGK